MTNDLQYKIIINEPTIYKIAVQYLMNHYTRLSSKKYLNKNRIEIDEASKVKNAIVEIFTYLKLDWEIIHNLQINYGTIDKKLVKDLKRKYKTKRTK